MADITTKIEGQKELEEFFKRLPKQLNNPKNLTKIFRENSKPLTLAAKGFVPVKTGQLMRSIGFFTTKKSRKIGGGYVGTRVTGAFGRKDKEGKYSKSGFYGAFVEYGGEVNLGGNAPSKKGNQEFMKPAYEQTKNTLMSNMLRDSRKMMLREVKRLRKFGTLGYNR